MKVYIAAPWTRKAEAASAAAMFEAVGHTITKKWWEHVEVPGYLQPGIMDVARCELQQQAFEDEEGVRTCDAFVLLNLEKSEGKAVETGFAIAYAKILVGVGNLTNLFHYDPMWDWYYDVEGAVNRLTPTTSPA